MCNSGFSLCQVRAPTSR
uniref:Uncharacterized protein n=1 Tax=Arundo donax TaxID=35708 RepID=A0A0A8YLE7_ARUDO